MIDDVAEQHLRPLVESNPHAVTLLALLIPSSIALLSVAVGPSLASLSAENMVNSPFVDPPFVEIGFIYGFIAGSVVVATSTLITDIDCFGDAVDATENRIATERYPKYGENK